MKKLVKCISSFDELDVDLFNRLNIGVEIQDFTEPNLSSEERRKIIDNYKIAFESFEGIKSLHGPFLDLKPSSPDLLIREVSYKRYLDAINIATELDLDYIIFHSQINPYLEEPFISDLNNRQAKDFWAKILGETSFNGAILIENIFEETPKMLKEYIEIIDFPSIKINLDIGHAKVGKASLEEWIQSLNGSISYMHIHSNNGLYDQHLPLSTDEIKTLYYLLDKYNIQPVLSLEFKVNDIEEELKKYI